MLEKLLKLKNLEEGLDLLHIHFIKVHHMEVDSIYVEDEDEYYYYQKKDLKENEVILYKNARQTGEYVYLSHENVYPNNIYNINGVFYITWYKDEEGDE